ncbi:MAG: ribbon-helix-helix protein, CopG family [Nitrospirales bacterium]|nr:ribbon-helix-helix protein, CopG family [Nitrospirales bacterium]
MTEKEPSKRKTFSLSLDQDLMKEFKHLAVDEDRNVNDMTEEAMRDLLKKYKKKGK